MGWFGRKPRRVGFGTPAETVQERPSRYAPPPRAEAVPDPAPAPSQHTTEPKTTPDPEMAEKIRKMEDGLADLKKRAPMLGNVAERVAQRMMAAKMGRPMPSRTGPGSVVRWIIIAFVVMFFVLPVVSTMLIAMFSGFA